MSKEWKSPKDDLQIIQRENKLVFNNYKPPYDTQVIVPGRFSMIQTVNDITMQRKTDWFTEKKTDIEMVHEALEQIKTNDPALATRKVFTVDNAELKELGTADKITFPYGSVDVSRAKQAILLAIPLLPVE